MLKKILSYLRLTKYVFSSLWHNKQYHRLIDQGRHLFTSKKNVEKNPEAYEEIIKICFQAIQLLPRDEIAYRLLGSVALHQARLIRALSFPEKRLKIKKLMGAIWAYEKALKYAEIYTLFSSRQEVYNLLQPLEKEKNYALKKYQHLTCRDLSIYCHLNPAEHFSFINELYRLGIVGERSQIKAQRYIPNRVLSIEPHQSCAPIKTVAIIEEFQKEKKTERKKYYKTSSQKIWQASKKPVDNKKKKKILKVSHSTDDIDIPMPPLEIKNESKSLSITLVPFVKFSCAPCLSEGAKLFSGKEFGITPQFLKTQYPVAMNVAYELKKISCKVYAVGGFIRDVLLKTSPHDVDFTVQRLESSSLSENETIHSATENFSKIIQSEMPNYKVTYIPSDRFPFVNVTTEGAHVDISLLRKYKNDVPYPQDDRQEEKLREDVLGRDFTMNALCFDFKTFTLVDYCAGVDDINNRVIRLIWDSSEGISLRLNADPILMLRAVYYLGKLYAFHFRLDLLLAEGLISYAHLLQQETTSIHRLHYEINKLLKLDNQGFKCSMQHMKQYGLFQPLLQRFHVAKSDHLLDDFLRRSQQNVTQA